MTRKAVASMVLLAGTVLAVGLGYFQERPPVHVAIVADRSGSTAGGCASIVALAARALSAPGVGFDSKLWVMASGGEETLFQPILVGEYNLHIPRRAIEGKAGDERRRREFLATIAADCAKLETSKSSPVFLAAKQAIAQLKAAGCDDRRSPCLLFFQSDLEETEVRGVREAIAKPSRSQIGNLPESLDNDNIRVAFCGTAETLKTRHAKFGPDHADRLVEVWRSLFRNPALVSFEPYCPKQELTPLARFGLEREANPRP